MSKAKLSPEFIFSCLGQAENEEAYKAFLSHLSVDELKDVVDYYHILIPPASRKTDLIVWIIKFYRARANVSQKKDITARSSLKASSYQSGVNLNLRSPRLALNRYFYGLCF